MYVLFISRKPPREKQTHIEAADTMRDEVAIHEVDMQHGMDT